MVNSFNYYSAQTQLAYEICTHFFSSYYVHVANEFDPPTNPPSSNPKALCAAFRAIAEHDDQGDPKYKSICATLRKVARKKLKNGEITQSQFKTIQKLINKGGTRYFFPLVYIIPRAGIALTRLLPVPKPPNPLSQEAIIADLLRSEFDVIKI
jgi:hypothetical protein